MQLMPNLYLEWTTTRNNVLPHSSTKLIKPCLEYSPGRKILCKYLELVSEQRSKYKTYARHLGRSVYYIKNVRRRRAEKHVNNNYMSPGNLSTNSDINSMHTYCPLVWVCNPSPHHGPMSAASHLHSFHASGGKTEILVVGRHLGLSNWPIWVNELNSWGILLEQSLWLLLRYSDAF